MSLDLVKVVRQFETHLKDKGRGRERGRETVRERRDRDSAGSLRALAMFVKLSVWFECGLETGYVRR